MTHHKGPIPKKIHYVWVGRNKPPRSMQICMESWKRHLPDYDIFRWDESNSPMDHRYAAASYKKKRWAFVSDYIRFWALEQHGGIYLDTDMEVLRPLNDLLNNRVFFGRTSMDGFIACGIIGALPGHPFIQEILKEYDTIGEKGVVETSPRLVTRVYDKYENKDEVSLYDSRYLYPCNAGEKCTQEKLRDAYTNHHWQESWVRFAGLRKGLRRVGLMKWIKRVVPDSQ